jgi:hypothetical protein
VSIEMTNNMEMSLWASAGVHGTDARTVDAGEAAV